MKAAERKLASWGDAELDRMWTAMYKAEMSMDDMDLAHDSPKLKYWEELNARFRDRMSKLEGLKK